MIRMTNGAHSMNSIARPNDSRPKLLLVNSHLRDHLGHYFETTISVAEAARRAGWRPMLAAHAHCATEILPAWLESYPLFHADCPEAGEPVDEPPDSVSCGFTRWTSQIGKSYFKLVRAADRSAYHLLPPLFYDAARFLAYCGVPRWAHLGHQGELSAVFEKLQQRRGVAAGAEITALAGSCPVASRRLKEVSQRSRIMQAIESLVPPGFGRELEAMLAFDRDLRRFLALAEATPADHVLILSAHPRDAAAVHLAVDRLGQDHAPTLHLEFLNALFEGDPAAEASTPSPYVRCASLLFSLAGEWQASDRVRYYTDSRILSDDYQAIAGRPFGVFPIPFRAELLSPTPRPPSAAVRLGYFGEARDEKGFPWLPDLAEALRGDYLTPGRASLLIQANVSRPQYNPQSAKALERLKRFSPGEVRLFAAEAPLSAVEYYRMVSQADVVLLPYLNGRYRACTSGVLAEALAMGAPVVVPARTWMAAELPAGAGETFTDFESFVGAVKRVIDNYESYRSAAQAIRDNWRRHHSPDGLVAAIATVPADGLSPAPLAAAA